ncbi:microsomal glutathione S-transferase 1-like [Cimex lectularius]|uniref:Microsomal glutathione S-transferase 1 n=1 Tax=Cimex lectularius TaxID=79782 RepID=A0A8I6RT31_CIMLE|nr:microsomal glutathione S-transferase 1-like [Cimex lectularius]
MTERQSPSRALNQQEVYQLLWTVDQIDDGHHQSSSLKEAMSLFTTENPVFAGYAFYSALLAFKMLLLALLTGYQRFRKKAFVNPEDAAQAGTEVKLVPDEDVERIRRAHLNDMENIPIFMITGLIFVASDPNVIFALMMFRLYTIGRFLHTVVYTVYVVKQPARAISFQIGLITNVIIIFYIFVSFPQL